MSPVQEPESEHLIAVFPVKTLFLVALFFSVIAGVAGYGFGQSQFKKNEAWRYWAEGAMVMQMQMTKRFPEIKEEMPDMREEAFMDHFVEGLCRNQK